MLAAALFVGIAAPAACLSPTEITVRVETDMTCGEADGDLEKVLVGTGTGEAATVSLKGPCQDGFVGSVTIVPGKSDTIDIDVVGRLQGAKCDLGSANGDGCVVAKRRLSFIEHIPLTITVRLDSDCAGVECPSNQTCQAGVCVDPQCTSSSCSDGGDGGTTPRATILTAGGDATCASDGNGNWVCWGDSTGGKLFRSGTIPPTLVTELQGAKKVVLGRAHGCGVFPDPSAGDVVKCWGANDRFQAGSADATNVTKPSPVLDANGAPVTAPSYLAAGDDFTCAAVDGGPVLSRSIVECWGAGDVAQLGSSVPNGTPKATVVKGVTIGKDAPANALAAGANHACAIANLTNAPCTGGSQCGVVCWGLNKDGQCSTPSDSPAFPRLVATNARGIYAGGDRSFVKRPNLVDTAAELWAWGKGVDTIPSTPTPTKVSNFALVVAASGGTDHACVLDGIRPSCVAGDPNFMGAFNTTVPNATAFGAMASGWNHACALTAKSGQVWCWGKNDKLQLGADKATSPHRVTLPQ